MKINELVKNFNIFFIIFISSISFSQTREIEINQDSLITKLMMIKKEIDTEAYRNKFFTIQLYYGSYEVAKDILEEFRLNFPEWESKISFETPNYKVQVGRFKNYYYSINKLLEIKRNYPSAFLLEIKN